MAILQSNSFSSWKLSPEEAISGTILSTLQKAVIQNRVAQIAEQKLGLIFDPVNPADRAIQDSYLKGQIDVLTFVLQSSEEAEIEAYTAAQSQQSED